MGKRYIFIGDMHGCYRELNLLLEAIGPGLEDEVFSTGDFLDRGDCPELCLDLWIKNKYKAVLGNHDDRLIRWYRKENVTFAEGFIQTINKFKHNENLIEYLIELPYLINIEEINTVLVHAALNINDTLKGNIDNQVKYKDILLRGRYVRRNNKKYEYIKLGQDCKGDVLWSEKWTGEQVVIYGHTPYIGSEIKKDKYSFGIDNGCAYGGYLTGLIYDVDKGWSKVSIKALKKYWSLASKENIVII